MKITCRNGNLDILLKSRDITFPTKVHLVKAMFFSSSHVWMWELDYKESWALKNWCFELWCWRRLLRVPWIARRSNQSILEEISPEYSLEGLMLKLKLQYFGHLMQRTDSFEKTLMLGKSEGWERGRQKMRWLDTSPIWWTCVWEAPGVGDGQGSLACCSPWGHKEWDTTERLTWMALIGLPRWLSGKESTCQCKRHGFDHWVGKIPWRRKWQPNPAFLPGKSHGQRSLVGYNPCSWKSVRADWALIQQNGINTGLLLSNFPMFADWLHPSTWLQTAWGQSWICLQTVCLGE